MKLEELSKLVQIETNKLEELLKEKAKDIDYLEIIKEIEHYAPHICDYHSSTEIPFEYGDTLDIPLDWGLLVLLDEVELILVGHYPEMTLARFDGDKVTDLYNQLSSQILKE